MSMTFDVPPPPPKKQGMMPPPPPPKRQAQAQGTQPNPTDSPYSSLLNNPAGQYGLSLATGGTPWSGIAKAVASPFMKILDDIYGTGYGVFKGAQQAARAKNIPEALQGITSGVVSAASVPVAPELAAFKEGVDQLGLSSIAQKTFTPTQTISSAIHKAIGLKEAPEAKAIAGTADNIIQALLLRKAPEAEQRAGQYVAEARESNAERTVREQVRQAVAPKIPREQFNKVWDESAPYLKQEQLKNPVEATKDANAIESGIRAANNAIRVFDYNNIRPGIERTGRFAADQGTLSNALQSKIEEYSSQVTREVLMRMKKLARFYNKPFTIKDAYEAVRTLNADKGISTYFRANSQTRYDMLQNNPILAVKLAALDGYRTAMLNGMEAAGEKNVPELRKTEGSLIQARDMFSDARSSLEKPASPFIRAATRFPERSAGYIAAAGAGALAHLSGAGPVATGAALVLGDVLGDVSAMKLMNRFMPDATFQRAFSNLGKLKLADPYGEVGTQSATREALPPSRQLPAPATQVPAQYPNETGGPMDVRSGLGGSGMAPGLLPERGGPSASTPPPGGSFYEPGQKFVEGGTQPRSTTVFHDVINMPDELRTFQGVKALREQLVGLGVPRTEVMKMQLSEMWSEYLKRNEARFGTKAAPTDEAPGIVGRGKTTEQTIENLQKQVEERAKRRSVTKRKTGAGE